MPLPFLLPENFGLPPGLRKFFFQNGLVLQISFVCKILGLWTAQLYTRTAPDAFARNLRTIVGINGPHRTQHCTISAIGTFFRICFRLYLSQINTFPLAAPGIKICVRIRIARHLKLTWWLCSHLRCTLPTRLSLLPRTCCRIRLCPCEQPPRYLLPECRCLLQICGIRPSTAQCI